MEILILFLSMFLLFESLFILYLIFNNSREIKKIKWSLYQILDKKEKELDARDFKVI